MTTPPSVVRITPTYTATQWHKHGDHPQDGPDTDMFGRNLFVRRLDDEISQLVEAIAAAESRPAINALHEDGNTCDAPLEAHGFIHDPIDPASGTGGLVVVCPADWVLMPETGGGRLSETIVVVSAEVYHTCFRHSFSPEHDGGQFRNLVLDLDRCEHGRHKQDNCWGCPGGQSAGNQLIPPGTLIGHSVHGFPIVTPPYTTEHRLNPRQWVVTQDDPRWADQARVAAHSQSLARIGAAALDVRRLEGPNAFAFGPENPIAVPCPPDCTDESVHTHHLTEGAPERLHASGTLCDAVEDHLVAFDPTHTPAPRPPARPA